jgi:flagellar hook-basal body complex protein FliE
VIVPGVGATPFVPATITPPTAPTSGTAATSQSGFAESLANVTNLTANADTLAGQVATGQLTDIHQFTAAAAKAQLGVELTVAVRNRAVEAYQEIMRMQV